MDQRNVVIVLGCVLPFLVGCKADSTPAEERRPLTGSTAPSAKDWTRLKAAGWQDRVGASGLGLWVSVARQALTGIEDGRVRFRYACSTAAKGTGNREGSNQTPLGWHEIRERYGDGLPAGAIFNERKYTGRQWTSQDPTQKDLILSRIIRLGGVEPGVNAGPGIDSHARYIYIHGTPAEDQLGSPVSMGCIRLSNRDVIDLYGQTASGTRVLITEW
jgi:hypothetical protein